MKHGLVIAVLSMPCLWAMGCGEDEEAPAGVDTAVLDASEDRSVDEETLLDLSEDVSDAGPDEDVSDLVEETDALDSSADLDTMEVGPPEISAFAYVENPANVLSYFVEWHTNSPADTRLEVTCVVGI